MPFLGRAKIKLPLASYELVQIPEAFPQFHSIYIIAPDLSLPITKGPLKESDFPFSGLGWNSFFSNLLAAPHPSAPASASCFSVLHSRGEASVVQH